MDRRVHTLAALVACASAAIALAAPTLNVGSKRFTESYILGEILKQTAQSAGETSATHSQGLGNTAIVLNALTTGSIDVYPEYTGTIAKEILKLDSVPPLPELNAKLAPMGLAVAVPLGFNNTYALAMRADDARSRNIARLSDLKAHPDLRLGLSQEFIGRADGWPGLKRTYELPFETPRGLDHGLAYEAIARTPGRRDRHLLDRRQARQVRLDGARRRPHVLPALRRGAAVPRGSPAAPARRRGRRSRSCKARSTTLRCAG